MPKIGAEPIRKADAINAALECICEFGIEKITLDMVAVKAGFSKGIVCYYFKSKKLLIEECLKAFLGSYKQKIGNSLTSDMQPLQMINTVVEISLPSIEVKDNRSINVSTLEGADKICLPEEKIARLFVQFISKAATDEEICKIVKDIYIEDVEGIALLMRNAMKVKQAEDNNFKKEAYALLATIYGLSFFRTINFMPEDRKDNRDLAFDLIHMLFAYRSKEF